jgi:hypothetical protein
MVSLKEATKTYANLKIRIVDTAASRSIFRDKSTKGVEVIDAALRYIRSVPIDREILVIGYKGWIKMKGITEKTLEEALKSRLDPTERNRIRWLTWGNHTATNDHKDVKHVVLMGLNYLPYCATYAASGAAMDLSMRTDDPTDHPTKLDIETQRVGMLRDAALQGILRGNARKGANGDCGEMEVVVMQSRQSGLRA